MHINEVTTDITLKGTVSIISFKNDRKPPNMRLEATVYSHTVCQEK